MRVELNSKIIELVRRGDRSPAGERRTCCGGFHRGANTIAWTLTMARCGERPRCFQPKVFLMMDQIEDIEMVLKMSGRTIAGRNVSALLAIAHYKVYLK